MNFWIFDQEVYIRTSVLPSYICPLIIIFFLSNSLNILNYLLQLSIPHFLLNYCYLYQSLSLNYYDKNHFTCTFEEKTKYVKLLNTSMMKNKLKNTSTYYKYIEFIAIFKYIQG